MAVSGRRGITELVSATVLLVLDRVQLGIAWDMGLPTVVSTTGPTQVMIPLDSGSNKPSDRRIAVVYPKAEAGKVLAFVFRKGQITGGEKPFRFDKNDPASPPLEFRAMPELATTIDPMDAYGRWYEHI